MIIQKMWFHIWAILTKLFYRLIYGSHLKIGKSTTWRRRLSLMISQEGRVEIGKNCFFNNYCSINSMDSITIGDNAIFGENVKIYDHNHRFADSGCPIADQGYTKAPVRIGDNCWIGSDVVILKGANIGNHCVIGAGCVISGTIEENSIVRSKHEYHIEKILDRKE